MSPVFVLLVNLAAEVPELTRKPPTLRSEGRHILHYPQPRIADFSQHHARYGLHRIEFTTAELQLE